MAQPIKKAPAKKSAGPLPTLAELHADIETAFKNDKLNLLLNQPPHESWIKRHPMIKVKNEEGKNTGLRYIPVDKIEFLLTRIFGVWQREIKSVTVIFNSVVVVVRLHVQDPITGQWRYHDGVGASAVQLDSGADASDMSKIKTAGVQMAAPSATSYALKDAAANFGKLFGKDLNKWDAMEYRGGYFGEEPVAKTNTPVTAGAVAAPEPKKPKGKLAEIALDFGENGKEEAVEETENDQWDGGSAGEEDNNDWGAGVEREEEEDQETDNDSFEL